MIGEAILGAVGGGALRLAPELLKHFDAKNDRAHELAMSKLNLDFAQALGTTRVDEPVPPLDLNALASAYGDRVEEAAETHYPWIAAVSALVRPGVTGALVALYLAVRGYSLVNGAPAALLYSADDLAMLSGVLSFWFLNRTLAK